MSLLMQWCGRFYVYWPSHSLRNIVYCGPYGHIPATPTSTQFWSFGRMWLSNRRNGRGIDWNPVHMLPTFSINIIFKYEGVYFAHNEKLPIADCHFNSSFGCYFVYRLLLFQQSEKFAGKVGGGGLEMGIWVTLLLGLPKWVSKNGVEPFFFAWHSVLHFLNERRTFIDVMFRPFLPHAKCINNKFGRKSKGFSFQNPVAHTWSEPSHIKRRFCCVCRKRTDDTLTVECEGTSLIELNFPELIDRCWRQWLFGDLFWKNEALHSALLTRAYSDYKNCVLIKMCTFI